MEVKQIKIDFFVTPAIKRFVYVYLLSNEEGCYLIDSGVAGSETIIEKALIESGHHPTELRAIFLTHAHPDHIGTANYFRQKYGAKIYASGGERPWIEDIDLQFRERPIPNFYSLAGQSAIVDCVVKDGDIITLSQDDCVEVVGTAGHSVDGVSYRIGDVIFIGDTVPVAGDIPIFVSVEQTRDSLNRLEKLTAVATFYPAWDKIYSYDEMKTKIAEARGLINELENVVLGIESEKERSEIVDSVCLLLGKPTWKTNPLFATTVACCMRRK
ncbi:MAG: MBL fold metallo-hydrolase [Christensenellales bacterium]